MVAKKKRQSDPQNDSSTDSSEEKQQGSCVHINKAVDMNKLRKVFRTKNVFVNDTCSECSKITNGTTSADTDDKNEFAYDKTLWLCLNCGSHLCGREKNKHAILHFQTPRSDSHAIVLNTTTLDIYCYECNTEVCVNTNKKLKECSEFVKKELNKTKEKLENVSNNILNTIRPLLEAVPGTSMSNHSTVTKSAITAAGANADSLPRVRGLSNLGNTCFFNAVMQCLAQTPYLLTVLNGVVPGEEFVLPGGTHEIKEGESITLPSIGGKLGARSALMTELADTLEELQKSGGVFNPRQLFHSVTTKCPQFSGGDQHDSHELLRHLLESVRTDDLKRYQRVILEVIGWRRKEVNASDCPDEIKQKCKFYGLQAQNRIPIPDQVFQGKLVSTLVCQDCYHTSPRQEHFLDISLPINVETPKPPQRRKSSPEPTTATVQAPSKYQIKKEKERDKKLKRAQRHHNNKASTGSDPTNATKSDENSSSNNYRSSSSCDEQSDADVEDNLIEDVPKNGGALNNINRVIPPLYDTNGNNANSPTSPEKRDECPENSNKDSDDDENDSGIAASPTKSAVDLDERPVSRCDFVSDLPTGASKSDEPEFNNIVVEATISTEGCAKLLRQHSDRLDEVPTQEMEAMKLTRTKRIRTNSALEWSSTIAPRYACEDNECSIQSCLNNFTATELMSGNNKVGCDQCTEMFNGKGGKTYNTNATKQFLISSPPAVLILHLKRFQVYPRYMFRKLQKTVTFPFVLDLAPFCAVKVKTLPNVKRTQKKLLYSLYGIVEHSGGMHGGHYTAYVKVRAKLTPDDPRWQFLPQGCKAELQQKSQEPKEEKVETKENKNRSRNHTRHYDHDDSDDSVSSNSSSDQCEGAVGGTDDPEDIAPPPGKWYYVSDSHVQEATEDRVLNAQAYLLFYERIY